MSQKNHAIIENILFSIKNEDLPGNGFVPISFFRPGEARDKIFNNAIKRYAPDARISQIIFVRDSNTFKNGKDGLMFTTEGFASDQMYQNKKIRQISSPVRYTDLTHVSLQGYDITLHYRNGQEITVYPGVYRVYIWLAVNRIIEALTGQPVPDPVIMADRYQKGVDACNKGNYPEALELLRKAAEAGHTKAEAYLGWMYDTGKGIPADTRTAAYWYERAASKDNLAALRNLGLHYRNGTGVPQDLQKALELFRKAAELGNADAQVDLGYMYEIGNGIPKDTVTAISWYEKAASENNAYALYNLGCLYEAGEGVSKDTEKALDFFRRAAEQGHETAKEKVSQYNTPLSETASSEDTSDRVKTKKAAETKSEKNADTKEVLSPEETFSKALTFYFGDGVPADRAQAARYFAQAAEQGHGEAAFDLAVMYNDGDGGLPKDAAQCLYWLEKGASAGFSKAQFSLGLSYRNGDGVPREYLKSLELFCKAADQGHEKAQQIVSEYGIQRKKDTRGVPVSHTSRSGDAETYKKKTHIKVAVFGDHYSGKTTVLSALSCYFSRVYSEYGNCYLTREEILERQSRGANGLCKENGSQHEPYYMCLEDPDFLYTFIEIPSVFDYVKNAQRGMYGADVGLYVVSAQNGARNGTSYVQLALSAGIGHFVTVQTTRMPEIDDDLLELSKYEIDALLDFTDYRIVDGTGLEFQTGRKDFAACLAKLMKAVHDTVNEMVFDFRDDAPLLIAVKKVSRDPENNILVVGLVSRGFLQVEDEVQIYGYQDNPINAKCSEIQVFNLPVKSARSGDLVSVLLKTDSPEAVIRPGQFITEGGMTLSDSVVIKGTALSYSEGGRHTPFFTGYRPLLILGPSAVAATVTDITPDPMVLPGDSFTLRLALDKPLPVVHGLLRAILCEGGRLVGTGIVYEYIKE